MLSLQSCFLRLTRCVCPHFFTLLLFFFYHQAGAGTLKALEVTFAWECLHHCGVFASTQCLSGLISPNDSPLWYNTGRMMSLPVKSTSLTECQHIFSLMLVSKCLCLTFQNKQTDSDVSHLHSVSSACVNECLHVFVSDSSSQSLPCCRSTGWYADLFMWSHRGLHLLFLIWRGLVSQAQAYRDHRSMGGPDILQILCTGLLPVDTHKLACSTFHVYSWRKHVKTSKTIS